MIVYPVVCFAFVTIVVTQAQRGDLGIVGAPSIVGPPGLPGEKGTPQITYCPVSSEIITFLRQFRSTGLNGATGKKGKIKRQTSVTSWIYQPICLHAGLNVQKDIFEVRIEQCCEQCRFPNFLICMGKVSGPEGHSRCHSDAIRCIARCINTKGRKRDCPEQPVRPGQKGEPGPPGLQECPTTRKRVGNSYCLERSCIPL